MSVKSSSGSDLKLRKQLPDGLRMMLLLQRLLSLAPKGAEDLGTK
jgi:hypothetical protein